MRLGEFAKNAALLVVRAAVTPGTVARKVKLLRCVDHAVPTIGALADAQGASAWDFLPAAVRAWRKAYQASSRSCAFALGHEVDVADIRE